MKKGSVDPELVRELAKLLDETGLSEIEVADGPGRIRVARNITLAAAHAVAQPTPAAAPGGDGGGPAALPAGTITSPMVGTAYLSPEPDKPPYVRVGDAVTKGQTLLIVEAMKTMNPIPSPRDGKITRILVQNAQPIEFGQPLLVIE